MSGKEKCLRESSHITSSFREGGGGRRMMTLVIFLMGNNSNIDDEGRGGQKGHFREDVICERSTLPYMKGTKIPKDPVTACLTTDAHQCYSALLP